MRLDTGLNDADQQHNCLFQALVMTQPSDFGTKTGPLSSCVSAILDILKMAALHNKTTHNFPTNNSRDTLNSMFFYSVHKRFLIY